MDERRLITCKSCGQPALKGGNGPQLYCRTCSELHDRERKRKWARDNYGDKQRDTARQIGREIQQVRKDVGVEMSQARGLTWLPASDPELAWVVRVSLPFDYAVSKNHAWAMSTKGHVRLRDEHRAYRDALTLIIRQALKGQPVKQNRLWLDILVQKPNHRGDAVNVIDAVCDAIKHAIDLDDRWYSIRRLDWEIVKDRPSIIVGIGQEDVEDVQACSTCGRLLEMAAFPGSKGTTKFDRARDCRECMSRARAKRKEMKR